MSQDVPSYQEDHSSQIPALQVLINLGYQYLTFDEVIIQRQDSFRRVLLYGILTEQLRKINTINYKGEEYEFSDANIHEAIRSLEEVDTGGLVMQNEAIHALLCGGKTLTQTIKGDKRSYDLRYIDWEHPENNTFHVTAEFSVSRTHTDQNLRPDIVLFVNGIPLGIIECKRPDSKLKEKPYEQAISQHLRNQDDDNIPRLYRYSQLLVALATNAARYATCGTPKKFWSVWKEMRDPDFEDDVSLAIIRMLPTQVKDKLFTDHFAYARSYFDKLEETNRLPTAQDELLCAVCWPERLLELTYSYNLYDAGVRKIARYQQYFVVKEILDKIKRQKDGKREGGVVWHTQGSGKSLSMVMLAKEITRIAEILDYHIVLVTDRVDLDDQLYSTFAACKVKLFKARSGKHLSELLQRNGKNIITTVINKFEAAVGKYATRNESQNIFVLVDEAHRSNYGNMHANMRKVLPNACMIAFTGTPLFTKQKHTVDQFGGMFTPYTIRDAREDGAVVPLLYEGRHVPQDVDRKQIDMWFEKYTKDLTEAQAEDLKRKFSTADQLNRADKKIRMIAWDVSVHFARFLKGRETKKGVNFKAQLVVDRQDTALKYKRYLDEFNMVRSEVLISKPDDREDHEECDPLHKNQVQEFWSKMMNRFGDEKQYNEKLINAFKYSDDLDIIIVVRKLLVGFDAPCNKVMYLARNLSSPHDLLQAIARVNRLADGKEHGYIIDYYGVLTQLDQALDLYSNLEGFDKEDLEGTLDNLNTIVNQLPQRHSSLWEVFKTIQNKQDQEEYEQLLRDEEIRDRFKERLGKYSRCLADALSSVSFLEDTPEKEIQKYKRDLRFFHNLRASVSKRYAETIDFKEYESKIQKLIDAHIGADEVRTVVKQVDIFDTEKFKLEVAKIEGENPASAADAIAHRTKKTISEKWDEDPVFYKKFSEMLEDAIRDFWEQRKIDAQAFLQTVKNIMESVVNHIDVDLPEQLLAHDVAKAFYGVMLESLEEMDSSRSDLKDIATEIALRVDAVFKELCIVNWTENRDVQNAIKNGIEDALFDIADQADIDLTLDQVDDILEECMKIAKRRYAGLGK